MLRYRLKYVYLEDIYLTFWSLVLLLLLLLLRVAYVQ